MVEYLLFSLEREIPVLEATLEHIASYVHHLTTCPVKKTCPGSSAGLANASIQQRIVAIRLFYNYLVEEGIRPNNPVRRGRYASVKGMGAMRVRGLVPHFQKLPWIPSDQEWKALLEEAKKESCRNRMMFALAYDAALRREELCKLQTQDIDPAHRMIYLRAETTKGRRARTIPYSQVTDHLFSSYLQYRRLVSRQRGPLFLSESRRNLSQPITIWTWSKIVRALALRAGVPNFSTHSFRHLCLTDLARAGWDIHQIATFAGHKCTDTTMMYIHLSGRDLAQKLEQSMKSVHAWRIQMINKLLI